MRDYGGQLSFDPRLPPMLKRLRFSLIFQGQSIQVDIGHPQVRYQLREGDGLTFSHQGQSVTLSKDAELCLPLTKAEATERGG